MENSAFTQRISNSKNLIKHLKDIKGHTPNDLEKQRILKPLHTRRLGTRRLSKKSGKTAKEQSNSSTLIRTSTTLTSRSGPSSFKTRPISSSRLHNHFNSGCNDLYGLLSYALVEGSTPFKEILDMEAAPEISGYSYFNDFDKLDLLKRNYRKTIKPVYKPSFCLPITIKKPFSYLSPALKKLQIKKAVSENFYWTNSLLDQKTGYLKRFFISHDLPSKNYCVIYCDGTIWSLEKNELVLREKVIEGLELLQKYMSIILVSEVDPNIQLEKILVLHKERVSIIAAFEVVFPPSCTHKELKKFVSYFNFSKDLVNTKVTFVLPNELISDKYNIIEKKGLQYRVYTRGIPVGTRSSWERIVTVPHISLELDWWTICSKILRPLGKVEITRDLYYAYFDLLNSEPTCEEILSLEKPPEPLSLEVSHKLEVIL